MIKRLRESMLDVLTRMAIASMYLPLNKIRLILLIMASWATLAMPAWADTGGINPVSVGTTEQQLQTLCTSYLQPIGWVILFIMVVIIGIEIAIYSRNPNKRAESMGALPYLLIGGILIGGALTFSGVILGVSNIFGGTSSTTTTVTTQ